MKHPRVAVHLAWTCLFFLAVVSLTGSTGRSAAAARDVIVTGGSAAVVTSMPDALPGGPGTDDVTPVACKMRPECSTDSDCVTFCGPGGGHCVHSSCPIRICKCG